MPQIINGSCDAFVPHIFLVRLFYFDPVLILQRKYAFERTDIPAGENYVVKINYPFKVHVKSINILNLN